MNEMINVLENEEVMETVLDGVVESGRELSTTAFVGIGAGVILAGYAIYRTAPKAIKAVRNKISERKAKKVEKDYISEELEMGNEQASDIE